MQSKLAKTVLFAVGCLPFLVPSGGSEPYAFWSEVVAVVLVACLLLCGQPQTDLAKRSKEHSERSGAADEEASNQPL